MQAETEDCVVVGGGPAGLLAALYLQRFRRQVRLIDAGRSRARWIPLSRNCPGFPEGISGAQLLTRLRAQAQQHGVPFEHDRIRALDGNITDGFVLTGAAHSYRARRVLIATGVVDRLPDWPGVEDAIHRGLVRLCAVCDGFETAGMRLAVYGPVQAAIAHACFLRTFCKEVTALHPPTPVALEQRVRAQQSDVQLLPVRTGDCTLCGDQLEVRRDGEPPQRFDAVYIALGAQAQTDWASAVVGRQADDHELEVDAQCRTRTPGILAIGDVVSALNQLAVAFGHAALAASAVHQDLPPRPLRA